MMPTPDNTDSDLEVSPQERTVSNYTNSEVQHGKYITNIGHVENLHHLGDNYKHANTVPLNLEEQKEAVLQFLQAMEENFKYIRLFHTPQQIVLKKQYIPIQVTLERRYKHEVETTWSYAESEAESNRIYALKGFHEQSKETIVSWEDAKKEIKKEAKQENYKMRWSAVEALRKIGKFHFRVDQSDSILAALNDSDDYVRSYATERLGKIGNPQAVDSFNSLDSFLSSNAAYALGKIGNPQAVDVLIAALNHSDSYVRWGAAYALGEIGNPQAVDSLIAAFNRSDSFLRLYATKALGKIGNPQAVDVLIAALNHSDSYVRLLAAEALWKIGNPQAVDVLIAALNDSGSFVRRGAAEALGKIGHPQAVESLIAALNDSDSEVRWGAAYALGEIGNQEILEKLIKLPEINIDDPEIFSLARMLAVRFSKQKLPFIPVYREQIKYSPIIATAKRLGRGISNFIGWIRKKLSK